MGEARQSAFFSRSGDEAGAQEGGYDFTPRRVAPSIGGCIARNSVERISRRPWHGDVLLGSEIEDNRAFVDIAVTNVRAEVVGLHPSICRVARPSACHAMQRMGYGNCRCNWSCRVMKPALFVSATTSPSSTNIMTTPRSLSLRQHATTWRGERAPCERGPSIE